MKFINQFQLAEAIHAETIIEKAINKEKIIDLELLSEEELDELINSLINVQRGK